MELVFDVAKVKRVPIDSVRPNTWNPKEKDTPELEKIKKGLQLEGQRLPVIVRDNQGYEIVDGEQRWTAMKALGATEILIYNEGTLSDAKAKALTIWYEQQVPFEEVALAKLIKELVELQIELPYSETEIDDLIKMADFDFSQYASDKLVDEGDGVRTLMVKMNEGQLAIVRQAMESLRDTYPDASDARCLELICADYIAGLHPQPVQGDE